MTAVGESLRLAAPCRLLDWDSEHFGFPVAEVSGDVFSPELAAGVDSWCREHEVACVYLLVRSDDAETARSAGAAGYREVDMRVTLERTRSRPLPRLSTAAAPTLRDAQPADREGLCAIARTSHRATRFYFDGNFPAGLCDALYERWIMSCVEDSEHEVLVAEAGSGPAGYAATRLRSDIGQIVLFAVSESARGSGVGGELLGGALRRLEAEGARTTFVVTQARNAAALRLYERFGFRVSSTEVWLHKWFRDC
jgi:dTDP-4-amino-4,6-dideoxy-D-galactose acyltransferase